VPYTNDKFPNKIINTGIYAIFQKELLYRYFLFDTGMHKLNFSRLQVINPIYLLSINRFIIKNGFLLDTGTLIDGIVIFRWSMFVPAFATHVCLGAPYGWSAISAHLTRYR
jgi:hypothetical protein